MTPQMKCSCILDVTTTKDHLQIHKIKINKKKRKKRKCAKVYTCILWKGKVLKSCSLKLKSKKLVYKQVPNTPD